MPVHNWARVDANVFHHFHQRWLVSICDALNAGRLPPGYSALIEQRAGGLEPDVLALEGQSRARAHEPTGGTLVLAPPRTRLIKQAKTVPAVRGNRIVVRHRMGKVVCILEIVSPGNKSGKSAFRAFIEKTIEFLQKGIHLLIIDVLPPTKRDPQGIHKAIWDEFEEEPFELPVDKPLTLAAYQAGDLLLDSETTAYVEFVGIGDSLPEMPAYLSRDGYVPVPLEATYQAAWATCPAALRELVETGKLSGEE